MESIFLVFDSEKKISPDHSVVDINVKNWELLILIGPDPATLVGFEFSLKSGSVTLNL